MSERLKAVAPLRMWAAVSKTKPRLSFIFPDTIRRTRAEAQGAYLAPLVPEQYSDALKNVRFVRVLVSFEDAAMKEGGR